MMRLMNYQTLVNTMRTQKPYRGTTNKFPLSNRKQSHKYFLYDTDDDGQEIFRIIYGKRYESKTLTEQEYEADPTDAHKNVYNDNGVQEIKYYKWIEHPNEMGIVRPDNSFEFTGQSYGQGEMTFLSPYAPYRSYFFRDSKRSGMIYTRLSSGIKCMMPIFKNLRVDCDTMKPDPKHRYTLVGRRVNRKESKEFLKQYEDFFKISEAMMSNMSISSFAEVCREKVEEINGYSGNPNGYYLYRYDTNKCLDHAFSIMNDAPLDAASLFCLSLGRGIDDFRWCVSKGIRNTDYDITFAEKYFSHMKRSICNMLYEEAPDVFAKKQFEFGSPFPQSSWGYQVYVDDVPVIQY